MLGFFGSVPGEVAARQAEASARRALELDPDTGSAYTAIGMVNFMFIWDFDAAERAFERALQLNPSDPQARHGLGDVFAMKGDVEASLEQTRIARDLDPLSPLFFIPYAGHLAIAGRYDESLEALDDVERFFSGRGESGWRALVCWWAGREEQAVREYRTNFADDAMLLAALDRGYAEGGPSAALLGVARTYERRGKAAPAPMVLAALFAQAGDPDAAFRWIERAFEARAPAFPQLTFFPSFVSLRSDPRYAEILGRIGTPRRNYPGGVPSAPLGAN